MKVDLAHLVAAEHEHDPVVVIAEVLTGVDGYDQL
jgi:hypothetical protein